MTGKLYLVGGGPGDPGLLTLKGKRCIEQADVVIYDYLANVRLLDFAPPRATRVLVGKHGGGTRVEQEEINRLVLQHAGEGKTVVRLKGGDPFVFGRGAEEMEVARAAGIEVEAVPGVSAATAVPAYAGIPLTHRKMASSVVITTGYEYPGKTEPAVRWRELARSGSTLVLLMTTRQLRTNMEKLVDGGLPATTPTAVVEWGTRAEQRTIVGTAATIADLAGQHDVGPPALAVVGDVVTLRERLNWFERKPLFGKRIVITRPRAQAADFAERLEAWGAEVIPCPTIETVAPQSYAPLDDAIQRAQEFDWVIFTSANGVRAFFERLKEVRADIRDWHGARVAAIGPQTARALEAACVRVDVVPEEYRAEGVIAALAARGIKNKRILLPRASGARAVLPQELARLGAAVEDVPSYDTVAPQQTLEQLRERMLRGQADVVTFTSSSTVDNFAALFGDRLSTVLAGTVVGCIGPVTAQTARRHGMAVSIEPKEYTIPAFADAIVDHFVGASSAVRGQAP
jgi:uroporphyrinogen III methyltransferase/synthase